MPSDLKRSSVVRFEALHNIICAEDTVKLTALSLDQLRLNTSDDSVQRSIQSGGSLHKYLAGEGAGEKQETMILIHQIYSWGRLQITKSTLQDLADHLNVFPGFWDVVNTYGVKTHQDERAFYGWRSNTDGIRDNRMRYEHCYNVPFVEKHGRDLPDPWSLRQTGVYQQFYSDGQAPRWIMLNLRDNIRTDLEHVIKVKKHCCRLSVHVELLLILEVNWTEYIEYLSLQLRDFDNKAYYTTIDRAENDGFTVSYEDLRNIHMLQAKIERAQITIMSCIEIGTGCHCSFTSCKDESHGFKMTCQTCLKLLDAYKIAMQERLEKVKRLDYRLRDILNLLSRILVCRSEILLTDSNQASGNSLGALLAITTQSEKQQSSLTQILSVVQAESVLLKALSIVATVCLPASLIGTVFSSNLIQTVPDTDSAEPTRMALAPQFWIYVVLSLPTMFVMLVFVLYLDRRAYNRISAIAEEAGHPLPPRPSSWSRMSKNSSHSSRSKHSA